MYRMRVRLGLLVMVVLLIVPGLVHARPAADEGPTVKVAVKAEEPGFLAQAWTWLVSVFDNAGSFIDPLGTGDGHNSIGGTALPDAGSFIDPLGGGH